MSPLGKDEREVVIGYNDAERRWEVFWDSRTLNGKMRRLARQAGAEVEKAGHGHRFSLPGPALRFGIVKRFRKGDGGEVAEPRKTGAWKRPPAAPSSAG